MPSTRACHSLKRLLVGAVDQVSVACIVTLRLCASSAGKFCREPTQVCANDECIVGGPPGSDKGSGYEGRAKGGSLPVL